MKLFSKFNRAFQEIRWRQVLPVILITSAITGTAVVYWIHKQWSTNTPPAAAITLNAMHGAVPHKVEFDGAQSTDPEGEALKYTWSIDDEIVSEKPFFVHVFKEVGTFRVQLTVEDPEGAKSTAVVFIESRPPKKIKTIKEALKYYKYELGWTGPTTQSQGFRFFRVFDLVFKDDNRLEFKVDYKNNILRYTIFEKERKLIGCWTSSDEHGNGELRFNRDFSEARGWWSFDHSVDKKYPYRLRRVN